MAGPKNEGIGETLEDKKSIEEKRIKEVRAHKRKQAINRVKKQFKIFHNSMYGKAGLYILLGFAIMALLAPVLAPQPYSYVAPTVDTHVAKLQTSASLVNLSASGASYLPITASATEISGSFLVYYGSSNGSIYATGLGGSNTTQVGSSFNLLNQHLNGSNRMLPIDLATLSNYKDFTTPPYQFSAQNFILAGMTNGTVLVSEVSWSGGVLGSGHPFLKNKQSLRENGTLLYMPVSDTQDISYTIPSYVPFFGVSASEFSSGVGGSIGSFYTVTKNLTGYYLNAYTVDPIGALWSVKLSDKSVPSMPVYYGSFFKSGKSSMILEATGSNLTAYSAFNGQKLWSEEFNSALTSNPFIPADYQYNVFASNSAFVASSNDNVYGVYLDNGTSYRVLNTSSHVVAMSSSPGSSGFPTYLLSETNTSAYVTTKNANSTSGGFITKSLKLPSGYGSYSTSPVYDRNFETFILGTNHGFLVSIYGDLGTKSSASPYAWGALLKPKASAITSPVIFHDSSTGTVDVAVATDTGMFYIYTATPHDLNPLPPTFNTQSGATLPLGTNIYGQDVWSQFVQSFVYDWYFGLAIGVAVIVLAVAVAMVVGYISGATGSVVETLSLAVYLIPSLALLIAMASILGGGFLNLIAIVTVISWPFTTFTIVGMVRQIKSRSFVEAARLSGARTPSIIGKHILPNIAPLLLYLLALSIDGGIGAVSALQFLGLAPVQVATWGGMLSPMLGNFFLAIRAPWWVLPPSIALSMFIFAFIFVSRGLDEVTNPRLRRR